MKDNILIVDDTPANIHVLGAMLQPDYDVSVAVSGEMALETVFEKKQPDLILLDVMMPEMDGYEVISKLKNDARTRDIPVIFVTAKSEEEDEEKGLRMGAVDFLKKPVKESIALARIGVQLELKKYRDSLKGIAEKKEIEARLSKAQLKDTEVEALKNSALFNGLFMNSPHAIKLVGTDQKIIAVNQSYKTLFGLSDEDILNAKNSTLTVPDDSRQNHTNMIHNVLEGNTVKFETRRKHKHGCLIDVSVLSYPIRFEDRFEGVFVIYSDISERKRYENELRHQAFHDALTGIPNRILLMERLNRALERSKRFCDFRFAVMLIDLDKFKGVNDSLGHHAGDRLLVNISSRIKSCLRSVDTVARLGGDEFAVLVENIKSDDEVKVIAERIRDIACEPLVIDGTEVRTGASIGIVMETGCYKKAEDLLRDADHAMYHAKESGKSRYRIFNKSMHEKAIENIVLEGDLRKAVENDELTVYYQPIVSVDTGKLEGFESLLRWHHPEKGLISPRDFIPMAEENGMIVKIGHQVLDKALKQLKQWQESYPEFKNLTMSINISVKQFLSRDFVDSFLNRVEEFDIDPSHVNIELTETALMEHSEEALLKLNILREKGFHIVIDDFGTGYSSLAYLRQFPIDNLKIDRSFISPLGSEEQSMEIVKSILALSKSLGLKVVAEGVEKNCQLDILEKLSCQNAQGFLFSEPLPFDQADSFLKNIINGKINSDFKH